MEQRKHVAYASSNLSHPIYKQIFVNLIRFLTLLPLPDFFSIPQIIKFENIFFSIYENGRNDNNRNEQINPGFEGGTSNVLSLILIYGHQEHRVNYKIETLPLGRQIFKKIPFYFSLEAGPRARQVDGLGLDFICHLEPGASVHCTPVHGNPV